MEGFIIFLKWKTVFVLGWGWPPPPRMGTIMAQLWQQNILESGGLAQVK